MTMRECYEAIGGNYEAVLGRLHSEALIRRFALKFLEDQSYIQLKTGIGILMDMQMPVMDGIDAAKHIRQMDSEVLKFRSLLVTANAFKSDEEHCAEAGM